MKFEVVVFWVVTPCSEFVGIATTFRRNCCLYLQGEEGGSMVLWNFGILPHH